MSNKGYELFQEKKWRESAEAFEKSIDKLHPKKQSLSYLGICYVHLGEGDRAVNVFKRINPPFPSMAALNWAALLAQQRKFSESLKILGQIDRRLMRRSREDALEGVACLHLEDILSLINDESQDLPMKYFDPGRFVRYLSFLVVPFLHMLDICTWALGKVWPRMKLKVQTFVDVFRQQCWIYGLSEKVDFLKGSISLIHMKGYESSKKVYKDTFLSYLDYWLDSKFNIKDFLISSIKPRDAHALYCTIREKQPSAILEIGSFVGFSTSIMANAVKDNGKGTIHCVDPNMTFFTVVKPLSHAKKMLKVLNLDQYVQMHEGFFSHPRSGGNPDIPVRGPNASEFLPPIDLAFIDGDHEATAVLQDFMLTLPCLNTQANLIFHDVQAWLGVKQALVTIFQDIDWKERMRYFEFSPVGFDRLGLIEFNK
ncbi:MAG: class I SAM-dependent methyltransferase [Promethearchaeota archaeon]